MPAIPSCARSGRFLEHLRIPHFDRRLRDEKQRAALAQEVLSHVQVWCEDQGSYAVPAMMQCSKTPTSDLVTRRGAIGRSTSC